MDLIEKIEQEFANEFDWSNWQNEDENGTLIKDSYWTVPQVLWCKLTWIEEDLNEFIDEDSEHLETINQVKRLLTILQDETNGRVN